MVKVSPPLARYSHLLRDGRWTDEAHAVCKVWEDENRAVRWMARQLGTQPCNVRYNLVRPPPSERKHSHPPTCITPEALSTRRDIIKQLALQKKNTARGPKKMYPSAKMILRAYNAQQTSEDDYISVATVRRDLHAKRMVSRRRQRGPKRYPHDPATRLSAAKRYLRLGTRLRGVFFSDSKYFDSNMHGDEREWVEEGETPSRMARDTWAPKVQVWGCIGRNFKFLVRVPSHKPTAHSYKTKCLIPLVKELAKRPGGYADVILQYDGDRAYGANDVLQYLKNKGITTLEEWPARSPDLSPIENMWSIVQREVDHLDPSDAESLWVAVQRAWASISIETVNNLVGSFARRLKKCIASKGATITTKTCKAERKL